jgi:signal transduction histidine kinase
MAALTDTDRPETGGALPAHLSLSSAHSAAPSLEVTAGGGGISDASRRLRALAALSGSLTDPLTPEEAADVVERQALAVLGATSAVVVTLGAFPPNGPADASVPLPPAAAADPAANAGGTLTLVHAIGLPADVKAALQRFPLDAPVPLAEVARSGEPIFLHSESELRRYPKWGDALVRAGSCAAAVVPVWANGHLRGVLGLTWATPHLFDEDERAFVVTLGVMCAQAIMRGRLAVGERRAREGAEHANRAKTHFLRTISHELRTPMNAVLGYTQLLADEVVGTVSPLQKEHLRRTHDASEHLMALIDELLGFARLDAGEEIVRVAPVVAAAVVEEALVLVRPLAEKKGVGLRVEMPDTPIELHTDPLKLRQILVNLVANAVKYTDDGCVALILRITGQGAECRISFEVSDSGRGISIDDRQHIFESFWQVDQTLTRTSEGTGLGLAVARQLARLLGGDVVLLKSELGRGSTFIASLPCRYPEQPPLSASSA